MPSAQHQKTLAASAAVQLVTSGMRLGLGTGSTAEIAIRLLAERVKNQQIRHLQCVATSQRTHQLAGALGLPLTSLNALMEGKAKLPIDAKVLDLTFDGVDELDPALNLIKGGGGALYREKIVASASKSLVIMADASKQKRHLGAFALPVEVNPFGWRRSAACIEALGSKVSLRQCQGQVFTSDNGGWMLDCAFGKISSPTQLENALRGIVGVMETGLFIGMASQAFVGTGQSVVHLTPTAASKGGTRA